MEELSEKERIEDYAKELNISVIKDELDDFITLGTEQNWTYRTLLSFVYVSLNLEASFSKRLCPDYARH